MALSLLFITGKKNTKLQKQIKKQKDNVPLNNF